MKKVRTITLRIEKKTFEKIKKLAKVDNETLSEFVRNIFISYLSQRDPFFVVSYSRGDKSGKFKN
jgi:hypothetical protein